MSRVPNLVLDSDTGAAKNMAIKAVTGSPLIQYRLWSITRNLPHTQKAIIKTLSDSLFGASNCFQEHCWRMAGCGPQQHEQEEDWGTGVAVEFVGI